jgi:hypothetical protein
MDAVIRGQHTHPPNLAKDRLAEVRSTISAAVQANPQQKTGAVIDAATTADEALGLEGEGALPSNEVLKRTVRKRKQALRDDPPIPARNQFDFVIPANVANFSDGSAFLLLDAGVGPQRFLVFGSRGGLELMTGATRAFSDGTYKVCPAPWKQLYTIAVEHRDHHVPVLFILSAQQSANSYRRIFESVMEICPTFQPTSWMADYELAAWRAVRPVWGIQCSGCLFHHSQAVYRHAHDVCGLGPVYRANEEIRRVVGSLSALSLVPVERVEEYFELLAADAPDDLLPVLDYFASTWIGRHVFGRLVQARFPPESWNHFQTALDAGPRPFRTNNCLEGTHNAFKTAFGVDTDFWSFARRLKTQVLAGLRGGVRAELGEGPNRALGYVAVDKRIHALAIDFHNRPALRYLRAQAANIGAKN